MTSYEFGEIVLIDFPQSGTSVKKKRPALVILDTGDADLVVAPVTSRERSGPGDYRLRTWSEAGLLRSSWVRLAKVACLEKRTISRRLGRVAAEDAHQIAEVWREHYLLES